MEDKWWSLPYVAWPVGWIGGVLSGLVGNWIWEKIRQRRQRHREYFSLECDYTANIMHFEGQTQGKPETTDLSLPDIVQQIYRAKFSKEKIRHREHYITEMDKNIKPQNRTQ